MKPDPATIWSAEYSGQYEQNVYGLRIPTLSGRVFRPEAGHDSDVKPATIPINIRPL